MDDSRWLDASDVRAGRQCTLRLWLTRNAPPGTATSDPRVDALHTEWAQIDDGARRLFPGGVRVDAADVDAALIRTHTLVRDSSVRAIFDGVFAHDGVRVRVDILERLANGGLGIRTVRSAARVKDAYLDDAALQRYVLEGAGLDVRSVEVLHVDVDYVRGDDVEWSRFFVRADVTEAVAERLPGVPALVAALQRDLTAAVPPIVAPSGHCWVPHRCEFWAHCTREKPEDWIHHLPRVDEETRAALRDAGIDRITDIPDDFVLPGAAARIRGVLRSGRAFVSPDLAAALTSFGPPAFYLDFETMAPAVPVYPGTSPYERIPSQWSLHHVDADGGVTHAAFLADGRVDPRREVTETLLAALSRSDDPVVAYSPFESEVLADLAELFPDLAPAIEAVRERLRDLWDAVYTHVYDPAFRYSFSLKRVAPALVPGFGYGDLPDVADGLAASRAFARLATGATAPEDEAAVRRALLTYCERDTLALVELHTALRKLSRRDRP